jgi:thiol-disulfide isomerase/thioredoxin
MRNAKSALITLLWMALGLNLTSCATVSPPPLLKDRTLYIHESGKLYYDFCIKKSWLGKCQEYKTELYELHDKETNNLLKNLEFKCRAED